MTVKKTEGEKAKRGFALLSKEQHLKASRKGGMSAHALGKAHEFQRGEEAKRAGRLGGLTKRWGGTRQGDYLVLDMSRPAVVTPPLVEQEEEA